jgi:hypothetical protein
MSAGFDTFVIFINPPLHTASKKALLLMVFASTTAMPMALAKPAAVLARQNVAGVVVMSVVLEYM